MRFLNEWNTPVRTRLNLKSLCMQWEFLLLVIFLVFNIAMSLTTRNYLNVWNIFDMTFIFTEKAIVALIMTFIIITGNIDLSVASMMGLSSVTMAASFEAGMNVWLASFLGVAIGVLCGFLNGFIITRFELPAIIITLATFSFYRGIAYVILGDQGTRLSPRNLFPIWDADILATPLCRLSWSSPCVGAHHGSRSA